MAKSTNRSPATLKHTLNQSGTWKTSEHPPFQGTLQDFLKSTKVFAVGGPTELRKLMFPGISLDSNTDKNSVSALFAHYFFKLDPERWVFYVNWRKFLVMKIAPLVHKTIQPDGSLNLNDPLLEQTLKSIGVELRHISSLTSGNMRDYVNSLVALLKVIESLEIFYKRALVKYFVINLFMMELENAWMKHSLSNL